MLVLARCLMVSVPGLLRALEWGASRQLPQWLQSADGHWLRPLVPKPNMARDLFRHFHANVGDPGGPRTTLWVAVRALLRWTEALPAPAVQRNPPLGLVRWPIAGDARGDAAWGRLLQQIELAMVPGNANHLDRFIA